MGGIYIPNMEMPEEGERIVILIKSNGKCSYYRQEDTEYGICEPIQTGTAIQIPTPHGRLIDRDAVPEVSADPFEEAAFQDVLDDMPVILEAEGRS